MIRSPPPAPMAIDVTDPLACSFTAYSVRPASMTNEGLATPGNTPVARSCPVVWS
jgi:hypothetical protein